MAENLKTRIQLTARESFGLVVEIDQLELELVPPGLAFSDVVVRRPDRADPWVSVYRGRVQVRPWPSTAGALVIDHLELDGLEIDHRVEPADDDGTTDDEADEPTPTRLPVDIRELLIWNADIAVAAEEGAVDLEAVDLVLEPHPDGGRQIAVDLPVGAVTVAGREYAVEARGRARLDGSLDRPETLRVEGAQIFLTQIALQASGELALGEREEGEEGPDPGSMVLILEGGVSLAHLRELLPTLPDLRGDAQLRAEIRGNAAEPFAPPLVRFEADVSKLYVEGRGLGDVSVDAVYETTQINVEAFKVSHPYTGTITGSGRVDLNLPSPEAAVTARIHRLSLPVVMAKGGFEEVWVKMLISGDVQGTGSWSPLRFDGTAEAYAEDFFVLDRDFRQPEPEIMLGIERADATGPFTLRPEGIELRGVEVSRGNTQLTTHGFLSFDPAVGLDLNIAGEQFDMADVGPIAGVPFAGHGTVFAALEGPYGPEISISGTVALEEFAVAEVPIGTTRGTVIFEYPTLTVDRANVKRGRGSATGGGSVRFDPFPIQTSAEFTLADVDLSGLLLSAGVEPSLAYRLRAKTSGKASLGGYLTDPSGVIDVRSDAVALDGVPIGSASALITLDGPEREGDRVATVEIEARPGGGRVSSTIGVHLPEYRPLALALDLTAERVPFTAVTPLLDNVPFTGDISGTAVLQGPARALSGTLNARVPAFTAWGVELGATELTGRATDGEAAIAGYTASGRAAIDGKLVLGHHLPYSAEVTLERLPIHEATKLPRDLTVVVDGTVFSQGDLTRPPSISADIQLARAEGSIEGIDFALARPARLGYGHKRLDVVDVALQGSHANASVAGSYSAAGGLALSIAANGDLGVAAPFFGPVETARGPFEAAFKVLGDYEAPFIEGGVGIRGARLNLNGLREDLTDVTAGLAFTGRNVEINDGAARLGRGTVTFTGGALLPTREQPAQLNLYTDFQRVQVRPRPGMIAVGSGSGSITGPVGDLLIKGRVDLDELRYSRNLELSINSFFPRKDAPLKVPDFAPGQTVAVDVHVEAPGNIHLTAGSINAELKASLDFRGTTESLGLLGNLTPLEGTARYRDLVFEYVRGEITFTEEFRLAAKFDLTAQAEGCDMLMTLNLIGDSRGALTIEVTGEDEEGPVPEQDPLSCISYGVRVSEQSSQAQVSQNILGTESSGLTETLGSGLDIIWGVSGLDAKVRRLMPYVDEARITLGRSGRGKDARTAPRLVVRKDVGKRLQLQYDGALDEVDDHIVSLEYELNKVATVEGSWVSLSDVPVGDFGLDLRLRVEFD